MKNCLSRVKEYPVQGLTDVRLPQPKFPLETAGLVKGRVADGDSPQRNGAGSGCGGSE